MKTFDEVREAARRAMQTKGEDFVYAAKGQRCMYRPLIWGEQDTGTFGTISQFDPRTTTSCLVGVALDILDIPREIWWDVDTSIEELACDGALDDYLGFDSVNYLQFIQSAQDCGSTWGKALAAAEAADYSCYRDEGNDQ